MEYFILIGFVTVALIAMGMYIKRGFQGNLRGLADQTGEQYAPQAMTINNMEIKITNSTITSTSNTTTRYPDRTENLVDVSGSYITTYGRPGWLPLAAGSPPDKTATPTIQLPTGTKRVDYIYPPAITVNTTSNNTEINHEDVTKNTSERVGNLD